MQLATIRVFSKLRIKTENYRRCIWTSKKTMLLLDMERMMVRLQNRHSRRKLSSYMTLTWTLRAAGISTSTKYKYNTIATGRRS